MISAACFEVYPTMQTLRNLIFEGFFFFTFKWEKKSKWVFLKIGLLFCKLRSSMLVGALFNYLFFFSLISSFILVSLRALTGSIYCLCLSKCQS